MVPDLSPIFTQYERLRAYVDAAFNQVSNLCAGCVTCHSGCSDCCHALFDLSLVEAMYINRAFRQTFDYGPERSAILERAEKIDRQLARIKKNLYMESKHGEEEAAIVHEAAEMRVRCPLLDDSNQCVLYEARPITCRAYGIPTSIAGQGHVCGSSGFARGGQYPTVKLDKIQDALRDMSVAIEQAVNSRFDKLHEVYMPVSMALLTSFDDRFLGIGEARPERWER
ncbi:MAG: YkgJ family cysteine cluster protein [Desulfovibrionaceae bacterium]|nr:YkgJ family cysteine cluster protein [Desulfovibrionaceae bacterium]